jgi:enoyl-CoA hydratase
MSSTEQEVDYSKYTCLRVEKSQGIAEVVLSRAKQLNTMTAEFFDEIGRVFRALDRDPEVHAVVIWAEGRMFTAGLDLKAAAASLNPGTFSFPAHSFS